MGKKNRKEINNSTKTEKIQNFLKIMHLSISFLILIQKILSHFIDM